MELNQNDDTVVKKWQKFNIDGSDVIFEYTWKQTTLRGLMSRFNRAAITLVDDKKLTHTYIYR